MRTLLAVTRRGSGSFTRRTVDVVSVNISVVLDHRRTAHAVVVTAPFDAYHPFFSPSNRWLYFQPEHKNLYRVPGPAQNWATAPPEKVTDFSGIDLYIEDPEDLARRLEALLHARAANRRHRHTQIGSGGQGQARNMTRLSGEREARHAVPPYSPSSPSAFILRWSVVRSRPRRSAARDTFPFVSARTRAR